ncbi:MAG: PhnD/SsuA/transferrin family substrate-binding protein [Syntrophobacteraceae bacterium]
MKRLSLVVAVAGLGFVLGLAGSASCAGSLDFVIIQPGQPGTSEEAQPTMDALGAYVQKKLGGGTPVKGRYFNELGPALELLRESPPDWGIVSLSFYVSHGHRFSLKPLASSRPGGYDKDMWLLAVPTTAPDDWRQLKGVISGTMLFESDPAACLLFGSKTAMLPFSLSGTLQPLMALRQMMKGKASGVLLDRVQYEALKRSASADSIKIIHRSRDLPFSPVVSFGGLDPRMKQLAGVFHEMKKSPEGQALLKQLQTDGFGPADGDLDKLILEGDHGPCKP